MKLKLVLFLGLVLTLLFGFIGIKVAFASSFSLSGRISDSSGSSISGTAVTVTDPVTNTIVASTISDTQGNYTVSVTSGTYSVSVVPPSGSNFGPVIAPSYVIQSDTTINFILVPIGATVTFSGHVYGALGDPLPSQRVFLQNSAGVNFITYTNSSGAYSLQAPTDVYRYLILDSANYHNLTVSAPERYAATIQNFSLTQSTVIDFTIPAKRVSVHVQDSQNNPVGNVSISTSYGGSAVPIGGGFSTFVSSQYGAPGDPQPTTNSSGDVTLWLIPGTYTLIATPPSGSGFGTTSVSLSVATDEIQSTITVPANVTLSGHVYGALGDPLPSQRVMLQNSVGVYLTTYTNSSGAYSLQAPTGTYRYLYVDSANYHNLTVSAPERYSATIQNFSLTQSTVIDFTIPAKRVDIHIQDSQNNPVANVSVKTNTSGSVVPIGGGYSTYVSSIYGSPGDPQPTTNSSGDVTLWLIPGTYTITATPPTGSNFVATSISNVNITDNVQKTIILPMPVTLSGHVYGPLGDPLSGQRVFLQNSAGTYFTAYTNSSGAYSLQALTDTYNLLDVDSAGYLSFSVNAPERYAASIQNFSLTQSTVIDFTIPAKRISVHVQDSQNNPVGNVSIKTSYGGSIAPIGGGFSTFVSSQYGAPGDPQPVTDLFGNVTLWLIPGTYTTITATPPSGSVYLTFTLSNVQITQDQTEIVSLQYSHVTPVTTVNLATQNTDGTYSDPTAITLSATAASGYLIDKTYYTLDGGSQQVYLASFTVSGPGSHTITYWSIDNVGVPEVANAKTFTIHTNLAPVVSGPTDATINQGGTYTGSGSFSDPDSTSWFGTVNYGDGSGTSNLSFSGTDFTLSHLYGDSGTYTITVSITDNQGATSTTTTTVVVNNVAPSVGTITFSPTLPQIGDNINFGSSFTDPGTLDVHTASWDWGDTTSTGAIVQENSGSGSVQGTHSYTSSGTFLVTLTVTDNHGGSGQSTITVRVNAPPTANPGGPYSVDEGSDVALSGSGLDTNGEVLAYSWDLNNDGTYETAGQTAQFQGIDGSSSHTVGFKVCDPTICTTNTTTVNVNNISPTINSFSADQSLIQLHSLLNINGTFSDPGVLDTHFAGIDWGDGNVSNALITEQNGSGSILGSHTYVVGGTFTITLTLVDKDGGTASGQTQVVVNNPPTASPGGPYTVIEGASITLQGIGNDLDGDNLTYNWDLDNNGTFETPGQNVTFSAADLDGPSSKPIALQVCDDKGACATAGGTVDITNVNPTATLSNNGPINEGSSVLASFSDQFDPSAADVSAGFHYVYSCDNIPFSGVTYANSLSAISKSCSFDDNGTYTILGRIIDEDDGYTDYQTTVTVNNINPSVGNIIVSPSGPQITNTTINANASFTDSGTLDTHTAAWNWGDGNTTNGTITETNGSGSVIESHTYTIAGVYTLTLTVTDKDGGTGTKQYQYVVIYDPSAGFVTGGGQVSSSLFGISAKYTPNSQTPTGNVGYTFSNGNMVFASTSLGWLVVDGNEAFLNGTGTINGSGNYYFLVSVIDGSPDKFRIQITDTLGNYIYDNQPGAPETSDPTIAISAGQIKIH